MIYGFKHRGLHDLPLWADRLANLYWHIRVESKDKAKRRKYYRYIGKEKLRLAEMGIEQTLINAVCKYLSNLSDNRGKFMHCLLKTEPMQLQLGFSYTAKTN